jgi:SAM-dependent methyltransferase
MPRTTDYIQRANPAFEAVLATRTVSNAAAFFLPYLRPGMRVLDVGCGPGSITLGLAEVVAPGVVVGIDLQPAQVEQARALAATRGVTNVGYEVADLYTLPFPDGAFDAAFAHTVVIGLRERCGRWRNSAGCSGRAASWACATRIGARGSGCRRSR